MSSSFGVFTTFFSTVSYSNIIYCKVILLQCSATCGSGKKQRAVNCQDNNGNKVNESQCSHLTKPESVDSCMLKPCGDWRYGVWSDVIIF